MTEMRVGEIVAMAFLLASCGGPEAADAPPSVNPMAAASSRTLTLPSRPKAGIAAAERWELQPSSGGVALTLLRADRSAAIRLFCASGENRLLVNIPGFQPIASEERLSFGGGGDAVGLVADTRGDAQRGGVSGGGEVPDNLAELIGGRISASYGAQKSGPHPAPPQQLFRAFVTACGKGSALPAQAGRLPSVSASACLMQENERLRVTPRRAVGTEPFWAARIEGRCVNYSHPEDQSGTLVWTRYTEGPGGETWSGALGERLFELRMRDEPDCSDGMSDKRYPLAVELRVDGELRQGCAEPT